jgi:hypothetical protein
MTILLGLFSFIKSPIGRYVSLGILAAGLFFGARAHFRYQGKLEGKQEAVQEFTKTQEAQQAADRKATADHLAADNAKDQLVDKALTQSAAAVQSSNQALLALQKQTAAALNTVNGLKDGELHSFITRTLGIRSAGDTSPGYLPTEERAIATAVVDEPACRKETAELGNKVKALGDQVDQLNKKVTIAQDKFASLGTYTTTLEKNYTALYNAFPRQGPRTWWSLGLVRGKPKQLPTPDPQTLLNAKEAKK